VAPEWLYRPRPDDTGNDVQEFTKSELQRALETFERLSKSEL
jgi:hypothetical protein